MFNGEEDYLEEKPFFAQVKLNGKWHDFGRANTFTHLAITENVPSSTYHSYRVVNRTEKDLVVWYQVGDEQLRSGLMNNDN